MKPAPLILIVILSLSLAACDGSTSQQPIPAPGGQLEGDAAAAGQSQAEAEADHDHDHGHQNATPNRFGLEVINASKGFRAGAPFSLRVLVRNNESGVIQKSFDTVHEKKLHLIVVSEGLTGFQHIHPTMDADGFWTQKLTLPHGGRFFLFADGSVGGAKFAAGTELTVEGNPAPRPSFAPDAEASADGASARVVEGTNLPLSDHAHVTVKLAPADGWEPYLGEPGHLFMLRQDGKEFLHAHPKGAMKNGEVVFDSHFHNKGLYRAWAQFKRGGKVLVFPFTLKVGDAQ